MEFHEAIQYYAEQPLTKQVLLYILKDYKRPYDKINELVKKGQLILVKRGVYIPGPNLHITGPSSFLLANHILGPSYVSMETALSYWGFIPERVYEIGSVTTQKSKLYKTAAGRFSYIHTPLPYYCYGIKQVILSTKQTALVASAEKALCDKIVHTPGLIIRSAKQAKDFLLEDMRIEKQLLYSLNTRVMAQWIKNAPKESSLNILIKTLQYYD
jgi:hypothetical protein